MQEHVLGAVQLPLTHAVQIAVLQVGPVHPVEHAHVLGAEQFPLTQTLLHSGTLHVVPVQPNAHVHMFGAVQFPPFAQLWEHNGTSHKGPAHPKSQEQLLGPVHDPKAQPLGHIFALQLAPIQPLVHVHTSGAVHVPFSHP
jgi:hypothetical protein